MSRLRVIAGRPVSNDHLYAEAQRPIPVLSDEVQPASLRAAFLRWLRQMAEAVLAGVCVMVLLWFVCTLILSLGGPR